VRALPVLAQLLGRQLQIEDLAEKLLRLVVREEQLVAVYDGERGLRAQARERERRQVARDDDDVQHVGQVGEQAVHDRVYGRFRAEVVVVVEDDDELLLDPFEDFVEEHVHGALGLAGQLVRRLLQVGEHHLAEVGD
jgi:hypothetical protein